MKYFILLFSLSVFISCDSVEADNNNPTHSVVDTIYGDFEFDGYMRDYIVYLPSGFEPDLPLVFNLPGYDVSAQEQFDYSGMANVADTANFVLVVPSAVDKKWNSGIGTNPNWPTPNVDDVAFLSTLIDTMHERYSIDLERVYSCGWSNGGFMSYTLASQLGNRIAGIASVGGVLSAEVESGYNTAGDVPVMFIHGTVDPFIPYESHFDGWLTAEETIQFWVEINNISGQPDTLSLPDSDPTDGCTVDVITYSDSEKAKVVFCKIHGGGHTWPGGAFILPSETFGASCGDIHASEEIWNFFSRNASRP